MYLDKKTKKLLLYLSKHPIGENLTSDHPHGIYPTSKLCTALGFKERPDNSIVIPYLEKLKADGFILTYVEKASASFDIRPSVTCEFFKEYQSHDKLTNYIIPFTVSLITSLVVILFEKLF